MANLTIIIDKSSGVINPPVYGQYSVTVESVTFKSKSLYANSPSITHICLEGLDELTFCNYITQPVLYSIIKGHQIWENNTPVQHYVHIKQPTLLYFSDTNGDLITSNTPIVKLSLQLDQKLSG